MPLDHFITLGRSGLRVSPLCLGGMTFGEERGWGSSVAASVEIIDGRVDKVGAAIEIPKLNFPAGFLAVVGPHPYGGTTINGETFPVSPFAPKNDAERF